MLADFHYCCIKVLAEKAGFSAEEAQIIAFASQYTDDATEHKKLDIDKLPNKAAPLIKNDKFDPVCTAYKGINLYLSALEADVQKKVFIPFHFAPDGVYVSGLSYDYKVSRAAGLTRLLLEETMGFLEKDDNRLFSLVKLGVALHTLADSYAHEYFSGKHSSNDNDIEDICIKEKKRWKKLNLIEQFSHNVLPDVGHAEAKDFPDLSHLQWKYTHAVSGDERIRNNPEIFVFAAFDIFTILCKANKTGLYKETLFEKIKDCFFEKGDFAKKIARWRKNFSEINFNYDLFAWRKEALDGNVDWDDFLTQEQYDSRSYKWKGDLKFFYFHLAALRQREFILSCIKNF